ncbi:glycosyltransferase family 4 protein [Bacillus thuringiensis]|uniref:glycosyltransferase n=1 Tax=Bacillus thuringiensis TaxID=1428 RepID=UPI00333BBC91
MKKQLNVLMVLDSFHVGGTETHVFSVTRELKKQGVYVVIVANEGPMIEKFEELGCPIYIIDFSSYESSSKESSLEAVWQLKEIMEREKITIIHSHQFPSAQVALVIAKKLKIPFLCTIHGTYYDVDFLKGIKHDTIFISVSYPVQEWLQNNDIPSVIIPNGIDTKEFSAREDKNILRNQLGIPLNDKIVLYPARLSWEKADICMSLIQACEEIFKTGDLDFKLMILGTGHHDEQIQNYIQTIENSMWKKNIDFLGWKSDLRLFYRVSDCVVGTGRVALEAMSCERPVIAAGSKGFLGLINPNEYRGLYYYFGDHKHSDTYSKEVIFQSIKSFFEKPVEEQIHIGQESRTFVRRFFDIEMVVSQMLFIYRLL